MKNLIIILFFGVALYAGIGGGITEIGPLVGVETEFIPVEYQLQQNYPNPFNPETNIEFSIPKPGNVKIEVFDINGRKIIDLVDENLVPGVYTIKWNAYGHSSGIYLCVLTTARIQMVSKMVLIR